VADDRNILFYDGDCGLCQRSVRFLMRRDREKRLHFAPIQGRTAEGIVPDEYRESLSTLVYRRGDGSLHVRSSGALTALIDTRGGWRHAAKLALRVPEGLRDAIYRRIAPHRDRFAKSACPMPTPEERERLLD